MEPKTSKRIVSKGEYVKMHSKRISLCFLVLGLAVLGVISYFRVFRVVWFDDYHNNSAMFTFLQIACAVIGLAVVGISTFGAYLALQKAVKMNDVQPLTRANTANLPAPDSLVRASSEPMQAQEAVLLRAAAKGMERHEEQLVRASLREK